MKDKEINSYGLTRSWFDFSFENIDLVSPTHTAMYMWFIELNNRLGWCDKFASPASQTMSAIGLKSYNTYKKVFDDLVNFGFVKLITESKNQWTACIIALSKNDKAQAKALDKALMKHGTKQTQSTVQSTDSIIKPTNNETIKPINNIYAHPVGVQEKIIEEFNFKSVWNAYSGKKNSYEKDAEKFYKKSEGNDIDFEKLTKLAETASKNIYIQSWLNDVLPKQKPFGKADFKRILIEHGANELHVDDWLKVREIKRAANTETALNSFVSECNKNNFPVSEAVKICAEKSWQGFKYEWTKTINNGHNQKLKPTCIGQPSKNVTSYGKL